MVALFDWRFTCWRFKCLSTESQEALFSPSPVFHLLQRFQVVSPSRHSDMASPIPGQCCIPPPPSDYQGLGKEEVWEGLPVYLTGSLEAESAIVYIVDIFGWQVPQTRYLADKIAAAGHLVAVADYLEGDFFESNDPNDEYGGLPEYLARHSQPKAIAAAKQIVAKLRRDLGFTSVGVVGCCWGAKISIGLLSDDKSVQAAAFCHPSFLTVEEVNAVKVPLAILAAEIDIITPPKLAFEFGALLEKNPNVSKSFVKLFKGAEHGWTTRYDLNDKAATERAQQAHTLLLEWLHSTLHKEKSAPPQGEPIA